MSTCVIVSSKEPCDQIQENSHHKKHIRLPALPGVHNVILSFRFPERLYSRRKDETEAQLFIDFSALRRDEIQLGVA